MAHFLLTYGSLKRGYHNDRYLKGSEFICEARTVDQFLMFEGPGYPFVGDTNVKLVIGGEVTKDMLAPHMGHIVGELYRIDDKVLADLDRLEGHPRYYLRTPVQVVAAVAPGEIGAMEAFLYVVQQPMEGGCTLFPKDGQLTWPNPYGVPNRPGAYPPPNPDFEKLMDTIDRRAKANKAKTRKRKAKAA